MSDKKFIVKKFYKRKHELEFGSLENAKAHLTNAGLNSNTEFYAEVWQVDKNNPDDGEQVAFYERGLTELVMK